MNFTESHLRKMIAAHTGRTVGFHLTGGSVIRGVVLEVDKDQDGFIELSLKCKDETVRFVVPVDNILAYEVVGA